MNTIPQVVCSVIPRHMLGRVAEQTTIEGGRNARAALERRGRCWGEIHRGAKPVLVLIRKFPVVPVKWAAALDFLIRGLDALSALDIPVAFKAGKDL
jgi:hypothetical protein